jgi:lysosomal acid lipase/cholesteryl ester hydrolase
VTTADGYILNVYRITKDANKGN